MSSQALLKQQILKKAVVHGKVILSSGKEADYYVDLRRITLDHVAAPLVGEVMTKEQFTSATPFYIGGKKYNGDKTYYFDNNCIVKQIRSSEDEQVILESYECNVGMVS